MKKKHLTKLMLLIMTIIIPNISLAANTTVVSQVGNILYGNLIYVTNEVGGKITTLVGVLIIALFVFDIMKMVLQSQLSQISISAMIGNYISRLIVLAIVAALLLIPVPHSIAINNAHNLYQVLMYSTMNMWLAIGGMFFPDAMAKNIFINGAGISVPTAAGTSIVLKHVAPGGIVDSIIGIPISVIQYGVAIASTLVGFFAGLIIMIIGIYMLFKTVSMISIFISSLFEYSVLITLASLYLPFILYEGTKNKIGSKPLELFVTEGIKLVVTTGIVGIIATLFSNGYMTMSGIGIISGFMMAVAFSIMEKVMNNNNQIASSIINGGGLGVSTGNEFFAMANQVAMMGGAAMLMGANNLGSTIKAGVKGFNKTDGDMSSKLRGAMKAGAGRAFSNPMRHAKNMFEKGIGRNVRIMNNLKNGSSLKEAIRKANQDTTMRVSQNNMMHRQSALDNNILGSTGSEMLKTFQLVANLINPGMGYMLGNVMGQVTPDSLKNLMQEDVRAYNDMMNTMNTGSMNNNNMNYNVNNDKSTFVNSDYTSTHNNSSDDLGFDLHNKSSDNLGFDANSNSRDYHTSNTVNEKYNETFNRNPFDKNNNDKG